MWKIYAVAVMMLSGCSHFTINGTMCNQISNDPTNPLPKECQRYDEKKAQKAFDSNQVNQKAEIKIKIKSK